MAERRMFAKTIIDSDAFLDLPQMAQLLYFHLAMRADDDGFVNSPKKIMKFTGATETDLQELIKRKFIISFDSGVIAIKHWRIHNYIQKDRYTETKYKEEKASLKLDENKAYSLTHGDPMYTDCIQNGYNMDTQVRLGKSKSKDRLNINDHLPVYDASINPNFDEERFTDIIERRKS